MITEDRWYVIADSGEVPGKGAVRLERFGEAVALWRGEDGAVRALGDRCPHRGASLSQGEVDGSCLRCPFHAFAFDGAGVCTDIPAIGPGGTIPKAMRATPYVVREAHGWIWLWRGAPRDAYPEIPYFEELDASFLHSTIWQCWPVHISRAIENQLDAFHLPFVHKNTIGRFAAGYDTITVVTRVEEDRLTFWHKEFAGETQPERYYLRYILPNIWLNGIGPGFWVSAAFVPVDDDHTLTYVRFLQNRLTWPLIGPLFTKLMARFNHKILGEDRRVVIEQRPIRSALHMDEILIPQDRPIIEYRRMCEKERLRLEKRGEEGGPDHSMTTRVPTETIG